MALRPPILDGMKSYTSFCPISKAAEVFAERWTPIIIRELLCGAHHFNELETGVPGIPKALLAQRLRSLEMAGVVERRPAGGRRTEYHLTPAGEEFESIIYSLGEWGQRWVNHDIAEQDVDPSLLMWDMHRRIHVDRLPEGRTVVQFDFAGLRRQRFWLVLERPEPSVCLFDPGFDVDLVVTADTLALHRIWMGRQSLEDALRRGSLQVDGPPNLAAAFPGWLALSSFAGIAPAR